MKKTWFSLMSLAFVLVFGLVSCQSPLMISEEQGETVSLQSDSQGPEESRVIAGQNGTLMQYFHWYTTSNGTWWDNAANNAVSLNNMGITALWLPPAYKGQAGANDVGYGVYDLYDLGEFNAKGAVRTKYGTKAQYLNAISKLGAQGIQVYGDIVLNHMMGADATQRVTATRVSKSNRNSEYGGDVGIDAWTRFTFPARAGKYSTFTWQWYHFDGVDWAQNLSDNSIWKFRGTGKGWDWEVDTENQNYDYLMGADLDMDHPEVQAELRKWGKWYVQTTGVEGLRIDAVKHIKYAFFNTWLDQIRADTGRPLFAVGEFWSYEIGKLHNFITKTGGRMSLFDAPLHMNFYTASRAGGSYDMRNILNNSLMKDNPLKAVTIVDNHDTQPLQALESPVDYWFKPLAYAIILLREEGYPTVFHPDLYGATYTDKGITINMAPVSKLQKLIEARKKYAYGKQNLYWDHWDIVGWTREGNANMPGSGLAALVSDGPSGSKWMYVGTSFAGKAFFDYTGNRTGTVTINSSGWGQFWVNGGSVSVWVPPTSTTPSTSTTTNITFKVNSATTAWGQDVYIVGSIPELGSWNTANAKKLSPTNYPSWDGVVTLPRSKAIQFKFIKKNSAGAVVWEGGANRSWTSPSTTSGTYTGTWQN